jgi:hypothetical protein
MASRLVCIPVEEENDKSYNFLQAKHHLYSSPILVSIRLNPVLNKIKRHQPNQYNPIFTMIDFLVPKLLKLQLIFH